MAERCGLKTECKVIIGDELSLHKISSISGSYSGLKCWTLVIGCCHVKYTSKVSSVYTEISTVCSYLYFIIMTAFHLHIVLYVLEHENTLYHTV